MVLGDNETGLFVTIPIYFVLLFICAIWANLRNRQEVFQGRAAHERRQSLGSLATAAAGGGGGGGGGGGHLMNASMGSVGNGGGGGDGSSHRGGVGGGRSSNSNSPFMMSSLDTMGSVISAIGMSSSQQSMSSPTDFLSSHYLGGRALGPVLTTGTLFASFFSGYTVVGIPNEAYKSGWMALRWLAGCMSIMMFYFGTGLRLRKAALVRNHKTPIDFITDRFQSQILRYTVLILQIIPSMFYLMAQVVALKSTFNSIFDLNPDEAYPVLIIMAITLFFEWIGGLRCVAMTDCVQSCIMILAYLCLPPIVLKRFGGWNDLDPTTYPRPEFYQTPSRNAQLDFWQFSINLLSFFTFPHMMQRTYAAKDLNCLKIAYFTMAGGVWFLMLGGIFIGTMAVQILAEQKDDVDNPFTYLLAQLIDLGGFPKFIGLITITATLAAIMSTADSLLVATSQLITEEVVYPISPEASPLTMVWVGRAASFCGVVIASLMGISWDKGVSDVASINFQLSCQSVLIFIIGLFGSEKYDCHPWSLALASLCTFTYVFAIFFGYINSQGDDAVALNAGVSGLVLQMVLILLLEGVRRLVWVQWCPQRRASHQAPQRNQYQQPASSRESTHDLIFPNRPAWDIPRRSRFGEKPLTPDLLWRMMEGVTEPLADSPWYVALMFLAISNVTPWVLGGYPKTVEEIPETLVGGLPWWVVQMLISLSIPSIAIFVTVYRMPKRFPKYIRRRRTSAGANTSRTSANNPRQASTTLETPDPDVMELTPEELGHRTAYDKRNDLVYKRRRQILEKLGISPTEIDSIVASTQQHLQNFEAHL